MKKVFSVLLAIALTALLAVTAFAATDINVQEQKIVDAVAQSRTIDGKEKVIPADTQNQVKTYLMRDGVDLTESQVTQVVAKINACFDVVEKAGAADIEMIKKLPTQKKQELLTLAQEAGAVVDLVVTYDTTAEKLVFTDKAGTVVASLETTLKFTGAETTTLVLLSVGVLVLIVGGVAAAKKAGLFA